MLIDTHCHLDLYKSPLSEVKECEKTEILTIGMTNLPSHFEIGFNHLVSFKKVRLALGMHPLYADFHYGELDKFIKNLSKTSYIGEIGLDFSKQGFKTKDIQLRTFQFILNQLQGKKKILSIHSRQAEKEVLNNLLEYNIPNAIFHWYSGPPTLIREIVKAGYYFSINPAMIISESGKKIINIVPIDRILTESDGPFIKVKGRDVKPKDVVEVIQYLSEIKEIDFSEMQNIIYTNFKNLINRIR